MADLCHTVKLPLTFVRDYLDRAPIEAETGGTHFREVKATQREITLEASAAGLRDLYEDARFYADPTGMNPDVWRWLGPSARTVVRRLGVFFP